MTSLEAKRAFRRPLLLTAGIIGIIQSVGWSILSLLSVLCYNGVIEADRKIGYAIYLYELFHNSHSELQLPRDELIITPTAFNICMYFYLVLSSLWICSSSFLLWGMVRDKWNNMIHVIMCWVGFASVISILDLLLTIILAADYVTFSESLNSSESTGEKMIVEAVYGIVMSLAARGYVLWIVNVIFCFLLANFVVRMQREIKPSRPSIINAYGSNGPPKFDTGNTNESFVTDEGEFSSARSSFNPLSNVAYSSKPNVELSRANVEYSRNDTANFSRPNDNNYYRSNVDEDYSRSNNVEFSRPVNSAPPKLAKLAKIGKSGGRRTPPQDVPPPSIPRVPFIPAPDYSPPPSPKSQPKSVLKPQSKYIF